MVIKIYIGVIMPNNGKDLTTEQTYISNTSTSIVEVIWLRIKMINSINLRRFISGPETNAWGISCVKNSNTLARLQERSNMRVDFLCCNSVTYKRRKKVKYSSRSLMSKCSSRSWAHLLPWSRLIAKWYRQHQYTENHSNDKSQGHK